MKNTILFLSILLVASLACTLSSAQISATNSTTPQTATQKPANATNSTPAIKTTSATVTALETVYIRLKPDPRAEILGYLTHGATVAIYSCDGEWALIGPGMYVNSHYLSVPCP